LSLIVFLAVYFWKFLTKAQKVTIYRFRLYFFRIYDCNKLYSPWPQIVTLQIVTFFFQIVILFSFFVCFIIVQKWYLLGKCPKLSQLFEVFWKKFDNLRSWNVIESNKFYNFLKKNENKLLVIRRNKIRNGIENCWIYNLYHLSSNREENFLCLLLKSVCCFNFIFVLSFNFWL